MKKKRGKITLRRFSHTKGTVTFSNLTEQMVEKLLKMFEGTLWLRGNKSQTNFEAVHSYHPLPDPTEDAALAPFWERPRYGQGIQLPLFHVPADPALLPGTQHSVYLRGLCADQYSTRQYQYEAKRLKTFGFIQLRSQRTRTGKFIELWYLPSLNQAEGVLGYVLRKPLAAGDTTLALTMLKAFLKEYVSFRTLEVTCNDSYGSK